MNTATDSTLTTARDARAPGPGALKFVRMLPTVIRDPLGFMVNLFSTYGDVVEIQMLNRRSLFFNGPEGAGPMLTEGAAFSKEMPADIFGNSLFFSTGAEWKKQRAMLHPDFRPDQLERWFNHILPVAKRVRDRWLHFAAAGEKAEIGAEFRRVAIDVISGICFSAPAGRYIDRIGYLAEELFIGIHKEYTEVSGRLPSWVRTSGRRHSWRAVAGFRALAREENQERRAAGNLGDDMFGHLLNAVDRGEITLDDAGDQSLTLAVAGHETTGSTLSWLFYALASNPEVEQKVLAELATVLNGRLPTFADVGCLEYLRATIEETLRLWPPVYNLGRRCIRETTVGGYRVRPGDDLYAFVWGIHHHPAYWPNPKVFDPSRFLRGRGTQRTRYSYLPFGLGPRACIGAQLGLLEATVVAATLLQTVRPKLARTAGEHPAELGVNLKPKPQWVEFEAVTS